MYETVLKQIKQKVENEYNIFIPRDIIQLIYAELNKKHQCAIMIQNLIKELYEERKNKTDIVKGVKYILIEDEKVLFRDYYFINHDYFLRKDFEIYAQAITRSSLHSIERCYEEIFDIKKVNNALVELGLDNAGYLHNLEYLIKNRHFVDDSIYNT